MNADTDEFDLGKDVPTTAEDVAVLRRLRTETPGWFSLRSSPSSLHSVLDHRQLALPPVVLTELLSDPAISRTVRSLLGGLPLLQVEPGYWERAGALRASVLKQQQQQQKKKPRVADSLIAQSCPDQSTPLVTRDRNVRHCAAVVGLPLL